MMTCKEFGCRCLYLTAYTDTDDDDINIIYADNYTSSHNDDDVNTAMTLEMNLLMVSFSVMINIR